MRERFHRYRQGQALRAHPGHGADPARDADLRLQQAHKAVQGQRDTKPHARGRGNRASDDPRTGQGADQDGQHHGPEATDQRGKTGPGQELPDIRHQRRDKKECGSLNGRHGKAEQAHGNRRQSKAQQAFHHSCQQEDAEQHRGEGKGVHHPRTLPLAAPAAQCGLGVACLSSERRHAARAF
jgi:hypothetical protein